MERPTTRTEAATLKIERAVCPECGSEMRPASHPDHRLQILRADPGESNYHKCVSCGNEAFYDQKYPILLVLDYQGKEL